MNHPPKIAFLVRSLNRGGAERQVVGLAKQLHAQDRETAVIVFYANNSLESELHDVGVCVHILHKTGRWDIWGFIKQLAHIVRDKSPDILYSYLPVPNFFAVLLKPIFPRMRVVWGLRTSYRDLRHYDFITGLFYHIERVLSRLPDQIIVNSQAGFDYAAQQNYPRNKMIVVPNGFDVNRFRPDPLARERVRAMWHVAPNQKLIGLVGRLDPIKDHPIFLRAAALLAREREDMRFVCIGNGVESYERELKILSNELNLQGRLLWTGEVTDMPAAYNALDLLCSSSYGEGFPNAIGEAMACGIPCVVTHVGDSAHIVGDTGIVVPPKDPRALAEGVKMLLAQDLQAKGIEARRRICENFNLELLFERTTQALDREAMSCVAS